MLLLVTRAAAQSWSPDDQTGIEPLLLGKSGSDPVSSFSCQTDDTVVKVGLCFSSGCLVRAASNLLSIHSESRRVTQALAGAVRYVSGLCGAAH